MAKFSTIITVDHKTGAIAEDFEKFWKGDRITKFFETKAGTVFQKQNLLMFCLFAAGMSPIGALCLTIFGLWTLKIGATLLVIPSITILALICYCFPMIRQFAILGLICGFIAVAFYDMVRIPFIWFGFWGDFIPKIGGFLLESNIPNTPLGYIWRWLGNGSGMGLACVMVYIFLYPRGNTTRRTLIFTTGFGVVIWLSLIITLLFAPQGQVIMFTLDFVSFVLSLVGHLVYGFAIGLILNVLMPKSDKVIDLSVKDALISKRQTLLRHMVFYGIFLVNVTCGLIGLLQVAII